MAPLPALPLYLDSLGLADHQSLELALHWLRGGDFYDLLALEVSDSVLISMLLQAAAENRRSDRQCALSIARLEGYTDGIARGIEIVREAYEFDPTEPF